jgi:hypothetical protein
MIRNFLTPKGKDPFPDNLHSCYIKKHREVISWKKAEYYG